MAVAVGRKTNISYSMGDNFTLGTKVTGRNPFIIHWIYSGHAQEKNYLKIWGKTQKTLFIKSYFF